MSLETYLSALRDLATIPQPSVEGITAQTGGGGETLNADQLDDIEKNVAQFEQFAKEQPATTLADRSVLTLSGLANIRVGARLLALAQSGEGGRPVDAQAVGRESAADVVFNDPEVEAIAEAIKRAADYPELLMPVQGGSGQTKAAQIDLTALEKDIQAEVDAILKTGDAAVKDLAGAVAWATVGGTASKAIAEVVQRTEIFRKAQETLGRLKRLALRAIEAGVNLLDKALGQGRLKKFLQASGNKLSDWLDKGGIGNILGELLNASIVTPECVKAVRASGASTTQQAAARAAAKRVSAHAQDLANLSDMVTDVISWLPKAVWATPVGSYLAVVVVVAIAGVAWQVQDHLDTTAPFPMPNARAGMISAITSAVASS